jgi:hypothetical protein
MLLLHTPFTHTFPSAMILKTRCGSQYDMKILGMHFQFSSQDP